MGKVQMVTDTMTATQVVFNFFTVCVASWLAFVGLKGETFFLFSLLLMIDYITGVLKARALGHSITSNKMKYGIVSKMSLLFIPVALAIGAKIIGADFSMILFSGMNILVLSEIYSIFGNYYGIRYHEELPEYDAVSMLGRKIKNVLMRAEREE